MAKEIERKFLVGHDGWKSQVISASSLQQAYIASLEDRSVRVRIVDDIGATLTVKIGKSGLVRDEYEYEIPLEDARELITTSVGVVLEKTRYIVEHGGFLWEVDVFSGVYTGLVVAEVEMRTETDEPDLPAWIGIEVTGDRRYSNQNLAIEDLSGELCHGLSHPAQ